MKIAIINNKQSTTVQETGSRIIYSSFTEKKNVSFLFMLVFYSSSLVLETCKKKKKTTVEFKCMF